MTRVHSEPSYEVKQINWQLIVCGLSTIFQVGRLTKAIQRPLPMICIEFDVVWILDCLDTPLADVKLRDDFQLPEEDHVLIAMERECPSPGPWRKIGLDRCNQVAGEVYLHVFIVDLDWYCEPDTAFRRTFRAHLTLNKSWVSTGHVPCLITATRVVWSVSEKYKC